MTKKIITIKDTSFDAVTGAKIGSVVKPTPKPSRILMRSAVKKPTSSSQITVTTTVLRDTPSTKLSHKTSIDSVSRARKIRAQETIRSNQVQKFSHTDTSAPTNVVTTVAHVPVRAVPEAPAVTAQLTVPQSQHTNAPEDIFTKAIASASHYVDLKEQAIKRRRRLHRHIISMAIGCVALLIVAGFAAYLNVPSVQITVAGIRAGVATADVDFGKAGFAYQSVSVEKDTRIIGLKANGGTYHLRERATNWDGQTMIKTVSSTAADGTPNYSVVSSNGTTVYRFNDNHATWIKNGVWFQLSGSVPLTNTQVLTLANS